MSYPTFLYHETEAPEGRLIPNAEKEAELGPGWVDTPEAFKPGYKKPEPKIAAGTIPEEAARQGYTPQPFPAHYYNRSGESRLVSGAEELATLDLAEWKDTPDLTAKVWRSPAAVVAAAVALTARVPPSLDGAGTATEPPPVVPTFVLTDEQKTEFGKATVAQIVEKLEAIDNVTMLDALADAEAASEKPRKGVLLAIKARHAVLLAPAE